MTSVITSHTSRCPSRTGARSPDILRRPQRPLRRLVIVIVTVAVADLTTKAAVAQFIPAGSQVGLLMPMDNPRFALGVAAAHPKVMVTMMTIGIILALAIAIQLVHQERVPPTVAGLAIGGAVANTADRLLHGSVQDFLVLGPIVINLADLAVLVGVLGVTYAQTRRTLTKFPCAP